MSNFLSNHPEAGVAERSSRFHCPEVPVVAVGGPIRGYGSESGGPVAGGGTSEQVRGSAGPECPVEAPATATRTDTLNSLEHDLNDKTGCLLPGPEDSLVPDARANMTPSDMVTRRLEGLLYRLQPSAPRAVPGGRPHGEGGSGLLSVMTMESLPS
jgi:hypothetical protein